MYTRRCADKQGVADSTALPSSLGTFVKGVASDCAPRRSRCGASTRPCTSFHSRPRAPPPATRPGTADGKGWKVRAEI